MSGMGQPVIIVKKAKHHAGHHGGAWKVAYADFVTAMMAFFLVMWLVTQSQEVRTAVGGYFRDPGAFESQYGQGVLPGGAGVDPAASGGPPTERVSYELAVEHIRDNLGELASLGPLRDQVDFVVTSDGLRIELVEADRSSFFDSGSSGLRQEAVQILSTIGQELGALGADVLIEGHTDSRPYARTERYSNWELSSDRANAARRVLEQHGLAAEQVVEIRGHADRDLRIPAQPDDARNRRVSIVVRNRPEAGGLPQSEGAASPPPAATETPEPRPTPPG